MTTTKDSNKLTIYKGTDTDYAFIPLDVNKDTYYDFANGIIQNDASVYMKNIPHDSDLYNLINTSIIDVSPIREKDTINITPGTYNINGYLPNDMLTYIIKLYYIENFKYTLDVSQYTIEKGENIDTSTRGNTYMFTITPKLEDAYIENITVGSSQIPTEPGGGTGSGGSGSGEGDTSSGETEDPNKKYDIKFSVDGNQKLTLTRIGATNNYKLGGTLVIKYEQSDKSIKNDIGTISTNNPNYSLLIFLGNKNNTVQIQKIDGYNKTTGLWEGEININLDKITPQYILTSGETVSCELHMKISKDVPIFSKHGSRLNSYVAQNSQGMDNLGLYKFKINNIDVPNLKAYFLQPIIRCYGTWQQTVLNVMSINNYVSGIFIIVSDRILPNSTIVSNKTNTMIPEFYFSNFKVGSTQNNSIFTSSLNNNNTVVLDGPPIFLYDENEKQTEIQYYKLDSSIFNEKYFKYNSGNKFPVPASTERKKNIINLNNYKYLMYEYVNDRYNHYCGAQLSNADLSLYADKGKIFNVVYEVWSYITSNLQPSINTPIKNRDGEYILKAMRPIDKLDPDGTPSITTIYRETVKQYNLYSFKLSTTDLSTGIYEYVY